ncbi:hypothetical protein DYB38_009743 [Aphanomyces astaci]|uniref:Major facilitator superfamily (MFS) profile domain-containing protein n=1 Tax=Aphanomyces astaci TaxID=112090 RepID=A0A397DH17_APHAT|nr:hypothetical protein DYB36_001907 [Aphanomyces astaci]RHY65129.1 hypothetical protein DYB38_009743 [Aphanomyces astaci]RHY95523.1 hypothetical protein DYB31_002000 [Aphanomyces astaci]
MQQDTVAVVVVFVANILAYGFRSLLPSTPLTAQAFLLDSIASSTTQSSWKLFGVLESTFIATYALSFLVCAHVSRTCRSPLRVLLTGLLAWCGGAVLCGYFVTNKSSFRFQLVLGGRVLSGIGDGMLQALTPSIIERVALEHHRQRWMRLYFAGAAIGTGLGYGVGNVVTAAYGWQWAFYGYAAAMSPVLLLLCGACLSQQWTHRRLPKPAPQESAATIQADEAVSLLLSPTYIFTSLGAAATLFTLRALATYMPTWWLYARTWPTEQMAATMYGGVVTVTALVAAPLGGYLLTWASRRCVCDASQLRVACRQQLLHVAIGVGSLVGMTTLLENQGWTLVTLVVGLVSASGALNATSVVVLLSVENGGRSRAMQTFAVVVHLCGDIPAPVLVGWFMDHPGAATCLNHMTPSQDDGFCIENVQTILFWSVLWMAWTVLCGLLAYGLSIVTPSNSTGDAQHGAYVQETTARQA